MSGLEVEGLYTSPMYVLAYVKCSKCGMRVSVPLYRGATFNCMCWDGERLKTYKVTSVLPLEFEEVKG